MTLYLSNRDGNGKTNEEGHYKFPVSLFSGNVVGTGLAVTQNSPLGMSVLVAAGQYKIDTSSDYSYTGWNSASAAVTITTADPANPRITCIVLYVDKGAATSASPPNNPGITKLMAVNGTAGAVPSAPNGTTIQAAVGSGNPYIILANVTVGTAVTQITNANISDQRTKVTVGTDFVGTTSILDSAVTTNKLNALAVTDTKLAANAVTTTKILDAAVTDAKWRNGVAFWARRTAARSIAAATFALFACDTIVYNYGSGYSNTSNAGRFTAPVNGIYFFSANINANATASVRVIVELRVNGSSNNARTGDYTGTRIQEVSCGKFLAMNAGDYIEAWGWTTNATDISSSTQYSTDFGGFLVSRT